MPFRVCFVGDSGAGKSTAAWIMEKLVAPCVRVDVARPLHEASDHLYRALNKIPPTWSGAQDGLTLQEIRAIFLRIEPKFLETQFAASVNMVSPGHSIVNADCRMALLPIVQELGFTLVHLKRASTSRRIDISTPLNRTNHDTPIPMESCDFAIDNSGRLGDLERRLVALREELREAS